MLKKRFKKMGDCLLPGKCRRRKQRDEDDKTELKIILTARLMFEIWRDMQEAPDGIYEDFSFGKKEPGYKVYDRRSARYTGNRYQESLDGEFEKLKNEYRNKN